jgi:hypothetical protein
MEQMLAGLGNRVFLMRNVHDDQPVVFQSRWALSYLRGPMTLPQIKQLSAGSGSASVSESVSKPTPPSLDFEAPAAPASSEVGTRPVLPPEIPEYFRRPKIRRRSWSIAPR